MKNILICISIQLRETHQQKEKALAAFAAFVARTSNYAELCAAKERQFHAIDASRLASTVPEETCVFQFVWEEIIILFDDLM